MYFLIFAGVFFSDAKLVIIPHVLFTKGLPKFTFSTKKHSQQAKHLTRRCLRCVRKKQSDQ
jgi:hypothetical protein